MGWCGGTEIFDKLVGKILDIKADDDTKINLIRILVVALEDQDWDCQSDSDYYDNPLVYFAFTEIHPDWNTAEGELAILKHKLITLEKENAELRNKLKFEQYMDMWSAK